MWHKRSSLLLIAGLLFNPAWAFDRAFPAGALRGKMTPGYAPDITIDGKAMKLSPSARIFNQDNTIEMPTSLRGENIVINYTLDGNGNVDRIWLLSASEAAQKLVPGAL